MKKLTTRDVVMLGVCIGIIVIFCAMGNHINHMKAGIEKMQKDAESTSQQLDELEKLLKTYEKQLGKHKSRFEIFKKDTWRSFGHVRNNFLALKYGKDGIQDLEESTMGIGGNE